MSSRVAALDPWVIHQRLLRDELERESVFSDIAEELGIDMAQDDPDIAEQRRLMREREQAVKNEQARIRAERNKDAKKK